MKYQPLPVGVDNFEMLITRNYYYIDKTRLIKELLDKKGMVNLITRPRRFGKTLNLSMIQFFFEAAREEYADSLKFLSKCLYKYYGKKAIILIDEYDVPLENAFQRGFYNEMIDFIRSLFESALKTNDSLEFAVITGCLRISKESIFTDMNNLNIISILSNEYDEYFGFTDGEVKKIFMEL